MTLNLEEISYRLLPRVKLGRALADVEWGTLCAAAEVLLEGAPLSMRPEHVADNVERFMIHGRSQRAFRIRLLLTLVEFLPLAQYGGRFSRLDHATRRRVVEERFVSGHKLWGVCAKVRMLALMGMYGDRKAMDAIGFVPVALRARPRAQRAGGGATLHMVPSSPKE